MAVNAAEMGCGETHQRPGHKIVSPSGRVISAYPVSLAFLKILKSNLGEFRRRCHACSLST